MVDGSTPSVFDYLTIVGLILGILTALRVFGKDAINFYKRPRLSILEFDRNRDIRTFYSPDRQILGRFANLHVINLKHIPATRCVATITVLKTPPGIALTENIFALHWADIIFSSKSTGSEPVSIGPEPQRLDIAFTTPLQKIPGCWIAIPIALSNVLTMGNQDPNQAYLAPGDYEIEIDVRCENGGGSKAKFQLTSPEAWQNLDMVPIVSPFTSNFPDLGVNGPKSPIGVSGSESFSGPTPQIEEKNKEKSYHEILDEGKEMDMVVAPLYVNSRPEYKLLFFMKGSPGYYDTGRKRDKDYFEFWKKIKENQHLTIKYLRIALGNYFINKSNTVDDKPDEEYLKAEKNLIENVERRYRELLK